MAEVQWIKLYIDMFDKRKIKKIRRLPAGNDILLIWIMLLSMAGKCNAGGKIYITESVPFTEDDLADELGFELGTIRLAMTAFTELDMISTDCAGFININGWEEHQNVEGMEKIREQNRLRKQRQRENQKLLEGMSRDCHGTEEEREEEEEEEKEFHSFTHARETVDNLDERRKLLGGIGKNLVMLSNDQMTDLLEKMSLDEFNRCVEIVANCEASGKHYKNKTHYQAILDIARQDRAVRR